MKKKSSLVSLLFRPWKRKTARPLPAEPSRILIVRQDNRIGNLILITPFLELCRRRFPTAKIEVVVGGFFGEVLRNNPNIDSLHVYDQLRFIRNPWLFPLFFWKLRRAHFDVVFDMKPVLSFNNLMVTLLSGATTRIGFSHAVSDDYFDAHFAVESGQYEAYILAVLLKPWNVTGPLPPIRYIPSKQSTLAAGVQMEGWKLPAGQTVAIHTGGRGRKRVSLDDFLSLGRRLKEAGKPVLFFFGPDEAQDMAHFEAQGFVCVKPKTVEHFGGFLPHLSLFVSCDTGPMHLAAGAGVQTCSIFINSSPERYAPRGEHNRVVKQLSELTELFFKN